MSTRVQIMFPDGRVVSTEDGARIAADLVSAANPNVWTVVHTPTTSVIQPGSTVRIPNG